MDVNFKFNIGAKVETPFGDIGYIKTLAFDEGSINKYWVHRSQESQWINEDQLKAV